MIRFPPNDQMRVVPVVPMFAHRARAIEAGKLIIPPSNAARAMILSAPLD
ncbi:MAG: hypothetical protein Q8O99_02320 [bacterium]|nr:hypothetical protein [bacterium]